MGSGTLTPLTSQIKLVDVGVHRLTEIVGAGTLTPLTSQVKLVDVGVQTLTEIVDGGTLPIDILPQNDGGCCCTYRIQNLYCL